MGFIRKPSPPTGSAPIFSWCRVLLDWCAQFQCNSVTGGGKMIPNPSGGYSIQIDQVKAGGGQQGIHWASPSLYNAESSNSVDEIVIVPPGHAVVTDGIASVDSEDLKFANAGTWICCNSSTFKADADTPEDLSLATFHPPMWPPEGFTATEANAATFSKDATKTVGDVTFKVYWWPMSFYPDLKNDCDGSGNNVPTWYSTAIKHVDE